MFDLENKNYIKLHIANPKIDKIKYRSIDNH